MSQISLDHQVVSKACEHCGEAFEVSRGSVFDDGALFSLYLAGLHTCQSGKLAHLAIAVREGYKDVQETCAVFMQIWEGETDFEMYVMDAEDSPWRNELYLGRMMNREEALRSPLIDIFFHVADHVALDNPEVNAYLSDSAENQGHPA